MKFLDQAGGICVGCAHWDRHRWFHFGNGCMKALPLTRSSTVDKCTVENCSGFKQKTMPDLSEGLCGRCLWWQPAHVSGRHCCTRQFDGPWMEKDHQGLVESCTLFKHREYRCVQCRHAGRPQNEDPCASCDGTSRFEHIRQDMRAHCRGCRRFIGGQCTHGWWPVFRLTSTGGGWFCDGRISSTPPPMVKENNSCAYDEEGRTTCPEIAKLETLWNDARRQAQAAMRLLEDIRRNIPHSRVSRSLVCYRSCARCAVDRFLKGKENGDG